MAKKLLFVALGITVVLVAIAAKMLTGRNGAEAAYEAALQEQLQLARSEGLATSWSEYGDGIRPAKPEDNAAPFYAHVPQMPDSVLKRITDTASRLYSNPTPQTISDAEALLKDNTQTLEALDKGTKLPGCWFDRDWSKGVHLLRPEIWTMRDASKLLALRGALAASKGDETGAVGNAAEILQLANQLDQEGDAIGALFGTSLQARSFQLLANWSFKFRKTDRYKNALKTELARWHITDVRGVNRDDLLMTLELAEDSTTPEGRKDLGLQEKDVSQPENAAPLLISRTKAKAEIVKAERQMWAALTLPYSNRLPIVSAAELRIKTALAAYPTGLQAFEEIVQDPTPERMLDIRSKSRRLLYEAAYRALSQPTIPKTIKTSDLVSPFDGKPVDYSFDGQRITIKASDSERDDKHVTLKIPPDIAKVKSGL